MFSELFSTSWKKYYCLGHKYQIFTFSMYFERTFTQYSSHLRSTCLPSFETVSKEKVLSSPFFFSRQSLGMSVKAWSGHNLRTFTIWHTSHTSYNKTTHQIISIYFPAWHLASFDSETSCRCGMNNLDPPFLFC